MNTLSILKFGMLLVWKIFKFLIVGKVLSWVFLKVCIFLKALSKFRLWKIFWWHLDFLWTFVSLYHKISPKVKKSIRKVSWHNAKCWQIGKRKPDNIEEKGRSGRTFNLIFFFWNLFAPLWKFFGKGLSQKIAKFPEIPYYFESQF